MYDIDQDGYISNGELFQVRKYINSTFLCHEIIKRYTPVLETLQITRYLRPNISKNLTTASASVLVTTTSTIVLVVVSLCYDVAGVTV